MAGVHPFDVRPTVEDGDRGAQFDGHAGFGAEEVDAGKETVGLLELWQEGTQSVAEG